ncbi:MAG: acyltransferase family protein, partial [Mariniphaga sp.]|nr:acyltransferase family protein [Mariniphaga sp.]
NFLDNLRTFLIFLVIVLHSGMVYVSGMDSFWIVNDPSKFESLAWVQTYLDIFVMFIMFFVSGYFIPNSLKSKTNWGFIKSKFNRIMIPWVVAVFTLIPAYKAIFLFSRGLPQEEWFSYFHLFQRTGTDLSFVANNPTQSWLWFLPVLFVFQIMYLALAKVNLLSFKISIKNAVVLTFVIGLIYSMVISLSGLKGWAHTPVFDFQRERFLVYFMVFFLGSLCYKLKVFESQNKNVRLFIVAIAVLIPTLIVFRAVALNFFYNIIEPNRNYFFVSEPIDRLIYYALILISMLSFLYVFVHVFRFKFNKSNKIADQLNRNSYQVYIIHTIVLGIIATILIQITISPVVKYFILFIFTFVVCNVLVYAYQRIFKRNNFFKIGTLTVLVLALIVITSIRKEKTINEDDQITIPENIASPQMGLHEAALTGNIEVIRQYIKAGSDLNEKDATGGGSPLHTATTFDKTEIAMALIEAGADINLTNNEGSTPLHTATFFCRTEIVKALLKNGADVTVRNNAGSTALESVKFPFEAVKGIYEYLAKAFGA